MEFGEEFEADSTNRILIYLSDDTLTGEITAMINTQALTIHQYALLVHDLIRVGSLFYNVDPAVIWAEFDQERQDPEIKERHFMNPRSGRYITQVWDPPDYEEGD